MTFLKIEIYVDNNRRGSFFFIFLNITCVYHCWMSHYTVFKNRIGSELSKPKGFPGLTKQF